MSQLDNFKEFVFRWTYGHADSIRAMVLNDQDSLVPIKDFFYYEGNDFLLKSLKPNKVTLLHDYIYENIYVETSYALNKTFYEILPDIYEILNLYNADYALKEKYRGDNYPHYLMKKLEISVFDKLTNEVFTLLYQDREFLRGFNLHAATYTKGLSLQQYPKFLKRDGVFIRNERWCTWLRKGLFFRDKGRCAVCTSDLTGLFSTGHKLAIDHIIPLALGGNNDPTNLQILCSSCNGKKGGGNIHTSFNVPVYW
ncbi:HNH endonuclease [Enterobacter asburiae]|uniref:HNH endonuclease n=1 Tax=Enterobacter asburiae TaxID=61645 RepID=UPI0011127DD8|nr:HNH endonuclease signature motif containing protein [Enterobacter asburiae]